mgnify:CR=1 FL=1
MAYIGNIKERIEMVVTLVGDHTFQNKYNYYGVIHIYTMKDEHENVFVWKTGTTMGLDMDDGDFDPIKKGDTIKIKGTVKEHSEYRGIEQTVLTRVKVQEILNKALTKEQKEEIKRKKLKAKQKEQIASLKGEDFIYEMPYRQYKRHYSDCEILAGSYDEKFKSIKVIIREGRLKNSGTRFKSFSIYAFRNINNCEEEYVFKAICEENAWKQLKKEEGNVEGWYLYGIL